MQVRVTRGRDAEQATELGRATVSTGTNALVVVGGDGMVHLAAQVLAGTAVPLGVVPAGLCVG